MSRNREYGEFARTPEAFHPNDACTEYTRQPFDHVRAHLPELAWSLDLVMQWVVRCGQKGTKTSIRDGPRHMASLCRRSVASRGVILMAVALLASRPSATTNATNARAVVKDPGWIYVASARWQRVTVLHRGNGLDDSGFQSPWSTSEQIVSKGPAWFLSAGCSDCMGACGLSIFVRLAISGGWLVCFAQHFLREHPRV